MSELSLIFAISQRIEQARCVTAIGALAALLSAVGGSQASLFQHLDASVPGSFLQVGGQTLWLDQSGSTRNAVDDSRGSGSVAFSSDPTVFPTGFSSLRFEGTNSTNYGRLTLLSSGASEAVLDQSGANAAGFTVFVVARSDANSPLSTWNDLIGNTTDIAEGAFLMRQNEDNGRFQGAVGGLTVQNNLAGQNNYGSGEPTVYAFSYDPSQVAGEITLASSLNDYVQVFNLNDAVMDRDFSNNDPLTMGKAFDNSSRLFVGNVGEVKLYDAALNAIDFQAELEALTAKWTTSPDGRLDVVVDRATGMVTLQNPGSIDVSIAGLSLKSASASLDPTDWRSITASYDADSPDRAVDPDDLWIELAATDAELSEATLGTAVLAAGQTVSLGAAFSLAGSMDLVAEFADAIDLQARSLLLRYESTPPPGLRPGDYNEDGFIDAADYTAWRDQQGQVGQLPNEVVSLGRSTQEDYTVWASNFGTPESMSTLAVPEPARLGLVAGVLGLLAVAMVRGERVAGVTRAGSFVAAAVLFGLVAPAASVAVDVTVGAYYYPWWDTHDWDETLRARMLPTDQRPSAGYTPSSNPDLIAEHINQSHRGNISLWASSWWGPGSIEDTVLQTRILPHPRAGEIKHAVHYESTGRFGSFASPDYSALTPDLLYLADSIFSDPNYYRIDGRPVVFMYVTRAYFNDPAAQQALLAARQAVQAAHGYDPYVVGDEVFGSGFNASRASHFDAVTTFDVYAMSGMNDGIVTPSDIDRAVTKYAQARAAGANVIPGVTPGYNDRAVRDGNQATGRYYQRQTIAEAGGVFSDLIEDAALPFLDQDSDNLLLVNSFNEWHEDTQIEATVLTPASSQDDSPSGVAFTQGVTYEGYGTKYLDLLRAGTTPGTPLLLDGDADFDGDLDADDLTAFVAAWGSENLVGGVRTGGYASRLAGPDFNYDGVVNFADWFVMRRTHPSVSDATLAALIAAPEPGSLAIASLGVVLTLGCGRRPAQRPTLRPDAGDPQAC